MLYLHLSLPEFRRNRLSQIDQEDLNRNLGINLIALASETLDLELRLNISWVAVWWMKRVRS